MFITILILALLVLVFASPLGALTLLQEQPPGTTPVYIWPWGLLIAALIVVAIIYVVRKTRRGGNP